ncbi:zinc finger CCCH domain-containing protein 11A isoform 1-T7 [Odontesthes bonariensis]|uniref:zinc finger CCCH domain-containing protein 11A n=1 Tax=Odontesthes bonariensis TaxID=219752 RepID=UPI003F58A1C4
MTNHGDDCYFYYYSTCSKGDSCPFRHCEAAMGNESTCNLWKEGRCFRTVCKFRHMEITINRKEIPCYWENQPAGCQKPHCAFFHERPRYIEGIFVPPDQSQIKTEEQKHEEPAPPPTAPLPTTSNPQLRGVIKTETQEPVPSPTHPPVVINPADDDEDEDDQFSEEGEDGKVGPSPRKLARSGDSLNFGVSTLEEIRLRKALKASMKRAGYPIQSGETSASGEKENILAFPRPVLLESRGPLVVEEAGRPRGSVAERLGRKIPNNDLKSGDGVSLRKSLAERLGRVVGVEQTSVPPQKALKPVKERLGLLSAPIAPSLPAENSVVSVKVPEQIHIKSLEEIKQEKAAKSQSHKDSLTPEMSKTNPAEATKGIKRAVSVRDTSISHVKTIWAKKKRQEEEREHNPELLVEKTQGKSQGESDIGRPGSKNTNKGKVKVQVKTLEEIRREKASRLQEQQAMEAEDKKSSDTEESSSKKPRLQRPKKLATQTGNITTEKSAEEQEKPVNSPAAAPETSNKVKVKTFEEIMQEKRLRKQEMEEQATSSTEASQKQTTSGPLKRKITPKIKLTPLDSYSPSSRTRPKVHIHKLISPTSKETLNSTPDTAAAALTTVASVSVKQSSSPQQAESQIRSREVPHRSTRSSAAQPTARPARETSGSAESPTDHSLGNNQTSSPEHTVDSKVRPKLNVKPSVMKPAVQVKPGQKKRGAERSAVAAVKPLNSTSAVQEDRQVFPSLNAESQLSSAVPHSPTTLLDLGSSSSPVREELQTVPVFKQSSVQETKPTVSVAAAREACAVPQSPVLKTPAQSKSRRLSVTASRAASTSNTDASASTSAVDDFEELINQFTDDHLEDDDVDPEIGEDDLLQELSEMIDS